MKYFFSLLAFFSIFIFASVNASDLLKSNHVSDAFEQNVFSDSDDLLNHSHVKKASEETVLKPQLDKPIERFCSTFKNNDIVVHKPKTPKVPKTPQVIGTQTPSNVDLAETYKFDLNYDVAEQAGINLPNGFEALGKVGEILFKDGQVFYDDQPLDVDQETVFNKLCIE